MIAQGPIQDLTPAARELRNAYSLALAAGRELKNPTERALVSNAVAESARQARHVLRTTPGGSSDAADDLDKLLLELEPRDRVGQAVTRASDSAWKLVWSTLLAPLGVGGLSALTIATAVGAWMSGLVGFGEQNSAAILGFLGSGGATIALVLRAIPSIWSQCQKTLDELGQMGLPARRVMGVLDGPERDFFALARSDRPSRAILNNAGTFATLVFLGAGVVAFAVVALIALGVYNSLEQPQMR